MGTAVGAGAGRLAAARAPQSHFAAAIVLGMLVVLGAQLVVLGAQAQRSGPACMGTTSKCSGTVNESAHWRFTGNCSGHGVACGEQCTVACDPGWQAGARSATIKCIADNSSSPDGVKYDRSLNCEPQSCSADDWPPAHTTGCEKSPLKVGDRACTAQCDPGWQAGARSATIKCIADSSSLDGVKYDRSLNCEPQSCRAADWPPAHTTGCEKSPLKCGESCTATCDPGWTNGKTDEVISCVEPASSYSQPQLNVSQLSEICERKPPLPSREFLNGVPFSKTFNVRSDRVQPRPSARRPRTICAVGPGK